MKNGVNEEKKRRDLKTQMVTRNQKRLNLPGDTPKSDGFRIFTTSMHRAPDDPGTWRQLTTSATSQYAWSMAPK